MINMNVKIITDKRNNWFKVVVICDCGKTIVIPIGLYLDNDKINIEGTEVECQDY